MVEFRAMKAEDIKKIAELEKLCFSLPWSEQSLREELTNSCAKYTIGVLDNEIVAYGGMWIIIDEAHITNVAVSPDHRRKGIAIKLLALMIKEAKNDGVSAMSLEVRQSNIAAIRLYEQHGFERYGLRKRYYYDNNEDAIIMLYKIAQEKTDLEI